MTSSTAAGSSLVRSSRARSAVSPSSAAVSDLSDPPYRPIGVRTGSQMTTSRAARMRSDLPAEAGHEVLAALADLVIGLVVGDVAELGVEHGLQAGADAVAQDGLGHRHGAARAGCQPGRQFPGPGQGRAILGNVGDQAAGGGLARVQAAVEPQQPGRLVAAQALLEEPG